MFFGLNGREDNYSNSRIILLVTVTDDVYVPDFHLTDKLKTAITEAKQEYIKTCKNLEIDYLIFNKVGKNMCKKQAVSPDALMQLGFQVSFHCIMFISMM